MAVTYEECTRINRISQETGVPCFVAYYRRYLPYFQKVKEMVENGSIGNVINVQVRFAQPPRDLDYNRENLPWRVQADIAGGGYFYDLAPHQIDLLQDMFGCILEASGYKSNRGGLYPAEDTLSACFQFDNGLVGSGSWCFVAHDSAREDRIEIIGDKGMICFSVFTYEPIGLHTERGREEICIGNPEHVQQPLIQAGVDHLLGKSVCSCNGESATLTPVAIISPSLVAMTAPNGPPPLATFSLESSIAFLISSSLVIVIKNNIVSFAFIATFRKYKEN